MRRRPLSAAAVLTATIAVAGCSGTGSVNDTYNASDLRYANDVITAHQRTLALAHSISPERRRANLGLDPVTAR